MNSDDYKKIWISQFSNFTSATIDLIIAVIFYKLQLMELKKKMEVYTRN